MTLYRFTSRAFQRQSSGGLDEECLLLIKALANNPVLNRASVAYCQHPPTLDIEAYVYANGSVQVAVAMAIDAAEYEWKAALEQLGLSKRTVNTSLSIA